VPRQTPDGQQGRIGCHPVFDDDVEAWQDGKGRSDPGRDPGSGGDMRLRRRGARARGPLERRKRGLQISHERGGQAVCEERCRKWRRPARKVARGHGELVIVLAIRDQEHTGKAGSVDGNAASGAGNGRHPVAQRLSRRGLRKSLLACCAASGRLGYDAGT